MSQHHLLPAWLVGRHDLAEPDMAMTRRLLLAQGVNTRGWRLYLDFGDALFTAAETPWFDDPYPARCERNAVHWLKLLQACEMDVPPPPDLLPGMVHWAIPEHSLARVPPLFLRAAWKACVAAEYEGLSRADFIKDSLEPVARWFFSAEAAQRVDVNALKAGWRTLQQHYAKWKAEQLLGVTWSAPVQTMEWADCRFTVLSSELDLLEEGRAMQHCVGEYGDRCRETPLRIYSVTSRRHGHRLATVSVECQDNGRWAIDQLKGPGNDEVDRRVWEAAMMLVCTLDQVCLAKSSCWIEQFKTQVAERQLVQFEPDEIPF